MKINFILPGYPWKPVGGFRVVYEYANRLVRRGHKVSIFHPRYLPNWNFISKRNYYDNIRGILGVYRNNFFKRRPLWLPLDKRLDFNYGLTPESKYISDNDVVIATAWQTAEYVVNYPQNKGKKFYLVMDFYPYLGPQERIETTWNYPIKKMAISHWLQQLIQKSGNKRDTIVIPCGIDTSRFQCTNEISKRTPHILMYYGTSSYKAPQDGIQALEIVKKKYPKVLITCFGSCSKPTNLPSWIQYKQNLSDRDLILLYNSGTIFLSSSLAEGFAFPPAEAMACGCAVVATDSGGIKEYLMHKETGLLSTPGDIGILAKNLLQLLENDNTRINLAEQGYNIIQHFTWEKSTDKLEAYITS